ncbi:hypothetical protein A33K_15417 [Burkholderia humptydooensis MSMB43]|uniref:Uncharacterized protein n=2 Tax=Burkholderia humptydooensis TaxID=430531 RepID=A0ABN0G5E3_9BURK|nr:hypothetical protein A33K_15417 [Burkholderia humptydooensis MSMB43]
MHSTPNRRAHACPLGSILEGTFMRKPQMLRMIVSPTIDTTMDLLLIATGLSVIGIGALVAFARHVDPLSGRLHGRLRKR